MKVAMLNITKNIQSKCKRVDKFTINIKTVLLEEVDLESLFAVIIGVSWIVKFVEVASTFLGFFLCYYYIENCCGCVLCKNFNQYKQIR